ncbi:MAG: hypothetical protein ACJA13_003674 [Paraglaciecola sp.]|jgi:hypothetical protein
MVHLKPLTKESSHSWQLILLSLNKFLVLSPNILLTMQRWSAILKGFGVLSKAVMCTDGIVAQHQSRINFAS